MITVYSANETNFTTNGLDTLQPLSCVVSVSVNSAWVLELEYPLDEDKKYMSLQKNNIIKVTGLNIIREQSSSYQLFRIYDTVQTYSSLKVTAFPVAFEAQYDAIIEELDLEKMTATNAVYYINQYLTEHGVTKYTLTADYTMVQNVRQRKGKWENTNLIAVLGGSDDNSIINHWGGELAYDNYKIMVNGRIGSQSDYEIRYGKDLTGLSVDIDMTGVATRLYPVSSDGMRLSVPISSGSSTMVSYVDSSRIMDYPYIKAAFVDTGYKFIDTSYVVNQPNTQAAILTHEAQTQITSTIRSLTQEMWSRLVAGEAWEGIFVEPEWLQKQMDDVIAEIQTYFTDDMTVASWKNVVKGCIKEGLSWIKNADIDDFAWSGSYEDGYNYESDERIIKNQYLYVDRRFCYFNSVGDYEPWKDVDSFDWIQKKGENGYKKYGNNQRYYARDTYVYTMGDDGSGNRQFNKYWFDIDGWWDGESNEASNWDWQGSGTAADPYWFGESGATSADKNKYAHDCWLYIKATDSSPSARYYFDEKGHLVDELTENSDWAWLVAKGGKDYFGSENTSQGNVFVKNQWLRIDGEWYKFNNDGNTVDLQGVLVSLIDKIKSEFRTDVNNAIDYYYAALKDLLYGNMVEFCRDKFDEGIDKPAINITANVIDLAKMQGYEDMPSFESMHLGDDVVIYDYVHGFVGSNNAGIGERVVGLKYDCIRGYNTEVTIGVLGKTVGQMISSTSLGSTGGEVALVAGDNVTINNNVINAEVPSPGNIYAGDQVDVQRYVTSGRKSADILINGVAKPIYCGNDVSITPRLNQGTKVADYSIDGNSGSLYAPSGLQYWTETEKKINKLTSVALPNHKTWDCDDIWKTTGFELNFAAWDERYPYLFAKTSSDLAFGFYSIVKWNGSLQYEALLISPVQIGACVEKYLEGTAPAYEYELDGLTFYKSLGIDMPYPYITPSEAGEPIFHSGHLQYLDYASAHGGEYGTLEETLAYFLEVSNFRTRDIYYSGIGNNNEYVIWGGYSKKSNPEITDMPFYVTDDGVIVCEDIYVDGSKPLKDVRKNGTSIVSNQIANITNFTGATSQNSGTSGLVPAPAVADREKFLRGDGTWQDASELEAVELTKQEYDALSQAQKEDTSKIYFVEDYDANDDIDIEDLADVNISNPRDGEVIKYDATSQKWVNGTGGGGTSEIVTNIMSDHSRWDTKVNTSQTAGWNLGTDLLGFSCSDSNAVGAQAVYMNAIPETVKKIRFKIDARTNNRPSASVDYDICIGIKSTYDNTNFSYPSDTTWITKKTYSTEQGYFEGELDIVATAPFYLYVLGHSWNMDIQELELIEYAGGGSGGGSKTMLYSRQSGDSEDTITLSEDFDHFDLLVISGRTYVDSGLWHQSNAYICDSLAVGNRVAIGDDGSISWFNIYNKTTLTRALNSGNPYQITHVMGVKF